MSTNFGPGPVVILPTLTAWTESHITAIFNAKNKKDLDTALDNFLAKDAIIVVNGEKVSHQKYAQQILAEKTREVGAKVTFAGSVEVPSDEASAKAAGSVGVFYNATITEKLDEHESPVVSHKITASVNVVIEQDPSIHRPHTTLPNLNFDPRRVKALNEVILDKPQPIR